MISKKFCSLLLLLLCTIGMSYAQQQINGRVVDDQALPVPGVVVAVKGGSVKLTTDEKGNFAIPMVEKQTIIVFSMMGMKTVEYRYTGQQHIEVVLESEPYSLNEVVAIGYGVVKKKDVTGAISTVDGKVLAERNVTQLSQALQGTMPGVSVTRTNSEPGATASVRVRGITTIGDSNPLVIVDGVPVNSLNDVNSDDVEDISVLKDAASASIYGARAAAGVILITTKRAKTNQVNMLYKANFGIEQPAAFPETVDAQRYLQMVNEFTWNDSGNLPGGEFGLYSRDQVQNWYELNRTNPDLYPVTDWVGLIVKDYAPRNDHYLSFSGGSEKVKTLASINYENVEGLYANRSYERITSRINNSIDISDKLKANFDLAFNFATRNSPIDNPIWDAQRYPAIFAAQWSDGRIAQGQNGFNSYAALNFGGSDNGINTKLNGRVSLEYRPISGMTITGVFAPYIHNSKVKVFKKQIPFYSAADASVFSGYISGYNTTSLNETRNDGRTFTKQLLVNYSKKLNNHNINLLAGYEDFYSFDEQLSAGADNYTLSNFPYLDLGPLDFKRNGGSAFETAYRSFFGRLIYDYKSKYLLQANLRYDGSSRFDPDYRWGAFPSISLGWVASEESFFPKNNILTNLKLRASWGQLGNERIGNYPYQSSIGYSNALFYRGNNVVSATTAAQFAYSIRDISWEVTETANIGLDMSFFANKLTLSADVFNKKTRDMLLELEIPDYMGFENPDQNTGVMTSRGWDLQLAWRSNLGKLNYSVSANVSDSRSTMGNLGGIVFDGAQITRQGSEYSEWFGYRANGLYQNAQDVASSAKLYNAVKPGDVKYMDISGPDGVPDGKITPDYDRVLLGGSLPRYIYGGNIAMDHAGFDLALAFQGVGSQNSRMSEQMVKPFFSSWTNPPKLIDGNYWSVYNTPEQNLAAKYPRLSNVGGENNNYVMSDHWLFNGRYFRLKNVTLGYALPQKLITKIKLAQVRVYASATDLFSVSNYPQGWDPESSFNTYISKSYNLGLSVKF